MSVASIFFASGALIVPRVAVLACVFAFFAVATGVWNPLASFARAWAVRYWRVTPVLVVASAGIGIAVEFSNVPAAGFFAASLLVALGALCLPPKRGTHQSRDRAKPLYDVNLTPRATLCACAIALQVVALAF